MSKNYTVTKLENNIWAIEDELEDSFYLIEGRDKALVIDTGMGADDIRPVIDSLTRLPAELALTHVHGDHCKYADRFDTVYWSEKERPLVPIFANMLGKALHVEAFTDVENGDSIDLGDAPVDVFALPGHTPGSLVFISHKHKAFFTGDAVGSGIGVLMAIPGTLPLTEYCASLRRFLNLLDRYPDYILYGGHRLQQYGTDREHPIHNPLRRDVVIDMIELTERILKHSGGYSCTEEGPNDFMDEPILYFTYGNAAMWLTTSQYEAVSL